MAAFFLQGIPTIDMPKGNAYFSPIFGTPTCVDTNTTPSGSGCNVAGFVTTPASFILGRSDYVAVVGAFVDASSTNPPLTPDFARKYHSLFNYNVNASLGNVPDGTSQTLLFSEYCGSFSPASPPNVLIGWNSASWAATGLSAVFGTCPDPNNSTALGGRCDYSSQTGAGLGGGVALGGWHNGVFQVAFADGSVRPLRVGLDSQVLLSLAGYSDGDALRDQY